MLKNYIIYKSTAQGNIFFAGFSFSGTDEEVKRTVQETIIKSEKRDIEKSSFTPTLHGNKSHTGLGKSYRYWAVGVTFKDNTHESYRVEENELPVYED
ncbi:hypothetical protein [Priestia megaterium]|uniref:hypothetical protein n=1 Tax=Priestia megaterium TaxID=1404 RepID=UPI000BFB6F56|nr:hypothetical protein [Priestia megaterium]PGR79736.1 hypothetical protein COC53_26440 [Priestia megaterium]